MVKKSINKYKSIQTINENIINENINLNNSSSLVEIFSSNSNEQKELMTSYIANYSINPHDEALKASLLNKPFLQLLSQCIISDSNQLRYNAAASIINLMTCYNDSDAIALFLSNTPLLSNMIQTMKVLPGINENTNDEMIAKVIMILFELIALMIDLMEEEGDNEEDNVSKLQLSNIAGYIIDFIMKNSNDYSNELYINAFDLLFKIISTTPLISSSCLNVNQFITYLIKSFKESNSSSISNSSNGVKIELMKAFQLCSLFYLLCINQHLVDENNLRILFPEIINEIYIGINYDLKNCLEQFSIELSIYTNNANNNNINTNDNVIDNDYSEKNIKENEELMKLIISLEITVHSIDCYIKTFNDIIENIDLSQQSFITDNSNTHTNIDILDDNDNDNDNDEDIEMTIEEIESDTNKQSSLIIDTHQLKYAESISAAIAKYYNATQNTPINLTISNLLNEKFLLNILNLQANYSIQAFFLNDFNKMLSIKEYLYNIEYISYTLINNIILQFNSIITLSSNTVTAIATSIAKVISIEDIWSDESIISIIILCLRTIISTYKSSITISAEIYTSLDYKSLFRLINQHINNTFIKCNIIDIIALIFCNDEYNSKHLDANLEICQLLNSMFYNEDNIEVLSHVINALIDIYQGDDIKINKNLKRIGCIQLMKGGTNEFKTRMMTAKKSGEMTEDVYGYVKETFSNMKRFIKYKEDSFNQLKI